MTSSTPSDKKVCELVEILEEAYINAYIFPVSERDSDNTDRYTKTYAAAEQWLLEHEGDSDLLKRAANQVGKRVIKRRDEYHKYDCTVLWYAVCLRPQVAFIKRILQLAPDTIKSKCSLQLPLPLHAAYTYCASFQVIKLLLDTYPEAATVQNNRLELPLHLAVRSKSKYDVIKILFEAYPEGAKVQTGDGSLPLHYACEVQVSDIASLLLDVYPEGAKVQDNDRMLSIHLACQNNATEIALKLLEVYPEGTTIQDEDGRLPLHRACRYSATDIAL